MDMNIDSKLIELTKLENKHTLTLHDHTELVRDLGIDSLTIVVFISYLEEHGIMVPDADLNADNFATVGAIREYVRRRVGSSIVCKEH